MLQCTVYANLEDVDYIFTSVRHRMDSFSIYFRSDNVLPNGEAPVWRMFWLGKTCKILKDI